MRHWDSPAAMVWMFRFTQQLIWPSSVRGNNRNFHPYTLKIQPVETIAGKAFQSRPHNIIQYILNETLGQSSSNGLDVQVHPATDLAFIS